MPALVLTFAVALIAGLFFTARIRDIAKRNNFVDCPDGRRKIQKEPIALGGGVAIYMAVIFSLSMLWLTWNYWDWSGWMQSIHIERVFPTKLEPNKAQVLLLSIAAGILCIVGMYDDRYHMRGRNKLLWQLFACSILVFPRAGIVIRELSIYGGDLGYAGALVTMIWFIVSINSFNLIDGVDGLAGTVGVIFAATFGIMALMMGNVLDGILAFILVGAILGFLRFNSNPASI
jgi:UDP-GlcNAc:undecaprenyl-phosphate GlcNAc-1-phosphate transferase